MENNNWEKELKKEFVIWFEDNIYKVNSEKLLIRMAETSADWWLAKISQARQAGIKETVAVIENYFDGLIFISDPKASKQKLVDELNNRISKLNENKNPPSR